VLSQLCWEGKADKIAGSQDAESAVLGMPKLPGVQAASMQGVRLVAVVGCQQDYAAVHLLLLQCSISHCSDVDSQVASFFECNSTLFVIW